jgi:hypothetical protein
MKKQLLFIIAFVGYIVVLVTSCQKTDPAHDTAPIPASYTLSRSGAQHTLQSPWIQHSAWIVNKYSTPNYNSATFTFTGEGAEEINNCTVMVFARLGQYAHPLSFNRTDPVLLPSEAVYVSEAGNTSVDMWQSVAAGNAVTVMASPKSGKMEGTGGSLYDNQFRVVLIGSTEAATLSAHGIEMEDIHLLKYDQICALLQLEP